MPDPQDPETFRRSRLDWSETRTGRHAVLLDVYRDLARLRREIPAITDPDYRDLRVEVDDEARTLVLQRGGVTMLLNAGEASWTVPVAEAQLVFTTPTPTVVAAGTATVPPHGGVLLHQR